MYATYPIYIPSARYARENGEIELWRESFKINKDCKNYISDNAPSAYHDENLPEFIKNATEIFGAERVMYVIGRTVLQADWDKRYYSEVRQCAEKFSYRDMKEGKTLYEEGKDPCRTADHTTALCSNVHPVMLNAIFYSIMNKEREQVNLPAPDIDRSSEHDEGAEH